MSPSRESSAVVRPSPLQVHRDSHFILKAQPPLPPSFPSTSSSSTSASSSNSNGHAEQQRQPVIIYTRSPKVIHTQPRDFMALVQKLTGMPRTEGEGGGGGGAGDTPAASHPENDESSCTTADSGEEGVRVEHLRASAPASSPAMAIDPPCDLFLPDVPLYTPTSCELYCYRHPSAAGATASNMGSSVSPAN